MCALEMEQISTLRTKKGRQNVQALVRAYLSSRVRAHSSDGRAADS